MLPSFRNENRFFEKHLFRIFGKQGPWVKQPTLSAKRDSKNALFLERCFLAQYYGIRRHGNHKSERQFTKPKNKQVQGSRR